MQGCQSEAEARLPKAFTFQHFSLHSTALQAHLTHLLPRAGITPHPSDSSLSKLKIDIEIVVCFLFYVDLFIAAGGKPASKPEVEVEVEVGRECTLAV